LASHIFRDLFLHCERDMSDLSKHHQAETESLQALQEILTQVSDRHPEPVANSSEPISDLVDMLVDGSDAENASPEPQATEVSPSPASHEEADEQTNKEATTTPTSASPSDTPPTPKPRRRRLQQILWNLQQQEQQGRLSMAVSQKSSSPSPPSSPPSPEKSPRCQPTKTDSPSSNHFTSIEPAISPNSPTQEQWEQLQASVEQLRKQIQDLKQQVYEPTELVNPLLPLIAELMESKIDESKDDIFDVMVPVIDRAIAERGRQDRIAMSKALSHVIPAAISEHIHEDPEDVARALAPTMGAAIREQIRLERDAMVDALYPVIGNTVSKYMSELVKSINDKIEKTLSVEGVGRKVRARMQGVSEAELIFRESMKFAVRAVFLIHKESGLAIAEAQPADMDRLESDMIAGMLTAIRSFANDTLSVGETASELHEIEYDTFQIELEVAGYCYLAVVVQGEPTSQFISKMRNTLSKIVERYHQPIKDFEGDPETVPQEIPPLLEELSHAHQEELVTKSRRHPPALLVIFLLLLGIFGFWGWRHWQQQYLIGKIEQAWKSTPSLAIYQLQAKAKGSEVVLSGQLPTASLRQQAGHIAAATVENRTVNNQIVAADVPPYPEQIAGEVQRLTKVFNQQEGIDIATTYGNGELSVIGQVQNPTDARRITTAMEQIPGLPKLVVALQFGDVPVTTRLYFPPGSNQLSPTALQDLLLPVVQFLQDHPQVQLTIIGHTDPSGDRTTNEKLSQQRAKAVQKALEKQGIDSQRLQVRGIPEPPPHWETSQPTRLARIVRFETQFSNRQNLR
jgi:outer membrane protein OmpA-like peptidoglycan-associated protein